MDWLADQLALVPDWVLLLLGVLWLAVVIQIVVKLSDDDPSRPAAPGPGRRRVG